MGLSSLIKTVKGLSSLLTLFGRKKLTSMTARGLWYSTLSSERLLPSLVSLNLLAGSKAVLMHVGLSWRR